MVRHSTYSNRFATFVFDNASKILVNTRQVIREQVGCFRFGMENDVEIILNKCICHYLLFFCRPYGANIILSHHLQGLRYAPPLPIITRPYGASTTLAFVLHQFSCEARH